jgi:basic membrane protein A
MDGTWKTSQYFGGFKEGVVDLAPISSLVPADIKTLVDQKKKAILSGELDVYAGPIKDQTGAIKIPAGSKASDADILSMNYFVQGVEGTIPQS